MKNKLKIVGSLFLATALLTGCSSSSQSSSSTNNTSTNQSVPTLATTWKFPFTKVQPLAKAKTNITMYIPANSNVKDYNNLEIFKNLEKETNVHVNWVSGNTNTLVAGGNLPDAFVNPGFNTQQLAQYGQDGAFLSWNKYLKYMPNVEKIFKEYPELKRVSTAPNGQIYSLPGGEGFGEGQTSIFANGHFLFINKKYLAEINQPVPTTLTQLHNDLLAFKTKLGVSNPMALNAAQDSAAFSQLFGSFGLPDDSPHIIVRNGKAIFTANQPQYKQAIDYFHSWVTQRLIDPASLTESADQYAAKEASGKLGAFVDWDETVAQNHQNDYVLVGPLTGPTGKKDVGFDNFYWGGPGAFVMTKSDPDPILTAKWINLVYAPYQASQMHWGPAGNGAQDIFNMNKQGTLVYSNFYKSLSYYQELRPKVSVNMGVITPDWLGKYVSAEPRAVTRLDRIKNIFAPYMEKEHYPLGAVYFTPSQESTMSQLQTTIDNYTNQMQATWLLKGGADQQWNSYVAKLNQMGLNNYMNIMQTALDQYVKSGGSLTK